MADDTYNEARQLWNYMVLATDSLSCEVMIVLGGNDDRVAEYAAMLTKQFHYETVVFSGGTAHRNDLLQTTWRGTEAEHFYDIFVQHGGNAQRMLLENDAQNTGQNATLSYELLKAHGIADPRQLQLVTKPYMLRRARATFEAQWPCTTTTFHVAGPGLLFDEYPDEKQPFETLVNIMVGDFQRILEYPKEGLQVAQVIPSDVLIAWKKLVTKGFDKHLIYKNNNVDKKATQKSQQG